MSRATPQPVRDAAGNLRPDLDFRDVPLALMALYAGCDPSTLWRRVRHGTYKHGIIKNGSRVLYRPALFVAQTVAL